MESKRKTSWTDFQLFNLSEKSNHKVVKEGDFYRWYSNPDGTWVLQSEKDFTTESKAFEYIYYNIPLWNEELFIRRNNSLKENLILQGQQRGQTTIRERSSMTRKEIIEIKKEFPYLSQKRIAEHLGVSVSTVKRALRKKIDDNTGF